jgi:hypothetical protein
LLKIRTIDDRDRPVRLPLSGVLSIFPRPPFHATRPILNARGLRRLARLLAAFSQLWLTLLAAILIVMLVVLLIRDTAVGLGLLVISPVMAPLVAFGLLSARGLLGFGGDLPRRMRLAALSRSRCPCCRYDLATLPAEPDGCLTCPECGAAWHWDALGDRGGREPQIVVISPSR